MNKVPAKLEERASTNHINSKNKPELGSDNWALQTQELATRVQELETLLKEYFIDTTYLDNLRKRKNVSISDAQQ